MEEPTCSAEGLQELSIKAREAICELRIDLKVEPTLDSIQRLLQEQFPSEPGLEGLQDWHLSQTTFYRRMKEAGFFFSDRASSYENAREDPKIRAMKADYLERIRQYCREGKDIYYHCETWLNKNMT